MADTRHKNGNWALPTNPDGRLKLWEHVPIAVLMDIRDELQKLNALLHCHNFVGIPQTLRAIKKNTTKTRKRKPK